MVVSEGLWPDTVRPCHFNVRVRVTKINSFRCISCPSVMTLCPPFWKAAGVLPIRSHQCSECFIVYCRVLIICPMHLSLRSVPCRSVTCRSARQNSVVTRPSKFLSVHELSYLSWLCTVKDRVRHKINDRKKSAVWWACVNIWVGVRQKKGSAVKFDSAVN